MSIHLSEEDRACLERLEKRPMKPLPRQKASALLRLAVGLSPSDAAMHAGISKEQVEALATEFAEGGLAGVGRDTKPRIRVRLVRPGVRAQRYCLLKGTTLSELLRRSGVTTTNQAVYVDSVMAGEATPLHDGSVVMIVLEPREVAIDEPWRATIPSFRDETLFQEYMEISRARRRNVEPDEDE